MHAPMHTTKLTYWVTVVLGVTLNQDTDLKSKDQFPGPKSKKMSFWSVVDN